VYEHEQFIGERTLFPVGLAQKSSLKVSGVSSNDFNCGVKITADSLCTKTPCSKTRQTINIFKEKTTISRE
jgi:hypothetical protein